MINNTVQLYYIVYSCILYT